LRQTAEQLSDLERWYRILSYALVKYLKGRQLDPSRASSPPDRTPKLYYAAARLDIATQRRI
jgi:hypothetical protein